MARRIVTWRYEQPYALYDIDDSPAAYTELTGGSYFGVVDAVGELVGYYCFGEPARVSSPGSERWYSNAGLLDIGLGLRPDLTGCGRGARFVAAGIRFGRQRFRPPAGFRLTVADFNLRALTVYRRLGFEPIGRFSVEREGSDMGFGVYARHDP